MRSKPKSRILSLCVLLLFIPIILSASLPDPSGYVNDFAQVLSTSAEREMTAIAEALAEDGGIELAVVTIATTDGLSVEEYAIDLAREWEIGKADEDTGILFLLAAEDRQVRIEVGYGLEGDLNDALVGRILDDYVIPPFREGDYSTGMLEGTISLAATLADRRDFSLSIDDAGSYAVSSDEGDPGEIISFLVMLVFVILFFGRMRLFPLLFLLGGGRRHHGYYGGGFGSSGRGGGFGGFSGGGFGGGGASRGF